jgi:hypothetical protein
MTRDVYQLAQVFNESKASGIPNVAPAEAQRLKGSLVTPGKHVTLVGPILSYEVRPLLRAVRKVPGVRAVRICDTLVTGAVSTMVAAGTVVPKSSYAPDICHHHDDPRSAS